MLASMVKIGVEKGMDSQGCVIKEINHRVVDKIAEKKVEIIVQKDNNY